MSNKLIGIISSEGELNGVIEDDNFNVKVQIMESGPRGLPGKDGYTPIKGIDYFDGEKGDKGDKGEVGPKGDQGNVGPKGDTGEQGPQGNDGYTPVKGVDYFDGKDGKDGYTPIKGIDYFDGEKGDKGDQGDQGIQGPKGDKGEQGPPGKDGYTPVKGVDYFDGSDANVTNTNVVNALGYIPLSEDSLPDNLETTTGSQDKANQAEQNAKNYTDSELSNFEGMVEHGNEYHTVNYATEFDLVSHKADDVSQGEIHGFRLNQDKKLEYFNGIEYVEVKGGGYPVEFKIYGVEIDESNSNPETSVTYTDDAVGFTPASGNNGSFDWGSWESIIKDEFKIRPVVLENLGGGNATVNYELQYDDYAKKADGSNSNLTGDDGDVMIEFGVDIYSKWTTVGSKHKIQFSTSPFGGATKNAFETEDGYNQFAYYPLFLTQKLFLLLFKNRDSQTALGRGYVDGNSDYATTGNTNAKGFMFGETTGKQQMKFLGIEDFWGNKLQWIDGLVTDTSRNLLIGNSNFNDSGSGYTSYSSGMSANTSAYIDTVQGGNDKGFIIKGKAGSSTTHYCDYGVLNSGLVARFGGYNSGGSTAGFATIQLVNSASSSYHFTGSRLMCINDGKLYIGAYLGITQGGKLRSVSGTLPSDTKTISVFRNEARANNS